MRLAASRTSHQQRAQGQGVIIISLLLALPVGAGILGVVLPAFGYFPALGGHHLSPEPFRAFLSTPGLTRAIALTLGTGLAATALTLCMVFGLLATAGPWMLHRGLRRIMGPLIAVPHSAMAIGILFLLAPSGWLIRLISPELTGFVRPPSFALAPDPNGVGLVFALLAKEVPFLVLVSLAALATLPVTRMRNIGLSLGYRPASTWVLVILPLVYRQVRLPLAAILIFSLSVVDATLLLGPSLPPTLAVLVVEGFHDAELTRRLPASAGAVVQILVTIMALAIWRGGEMVISTVIDSVRRRGLRLRGIGIWMTGFALLAAVPLMAGTAGLLAAAIWSMAAGWFFPDAWPQALTFRNWARFDMLAPALGSSLIIAVTATTMAIALVLTLLRLQGTRLSPIMQLCVFSPLLLPQISFVLGLQMVLTMLHLDGSWSAMIWLHMLFILPYAWLILAPAMAAIDPRYERVAASLGQSGVRRFFTVVLPLLSPAVITAAFIGISVSIALYLPSLFAGAGRITTITLEAVALASGGSRQMAGVSAMLQLCIPLIAFILLQSWQRWRFGRFSGMQTEHTG